MRHPVSDEGRTGRNRAAAGAEMGEDTWDGLPSSGVARTWSDSGYRERETLERMGEINVDFVK